MAKARKPSRRKLILQLDKITREKVFNRDGYKCVQCGSTQNLTLGHVFSRRILRTRWDLRNVWCQCLACNLKHVYNQYPFFKVIEEKLGKEEFEKLYYDFSNPQPVKTFELKEKLQTM